MNIKKITIPLCTIALMLTISSYTWLPFKTSKRETIFDRVVNIPKELERNVPYLPPLCDEIKDLKRGYVDIKDGKLYYEEEGHGIPLVLINGGPGLTHQVFHPYFSQLKDAARIIYYDQRATGKSSSDNTGKTYTIKQATQDLESLRKALKIDKWVVLGWSNGGLLAQCYALTYALHCIGLILGATSTGICISIPKEIHEKRERIFISQAEDDAIESIKQKCFTGNITGVQCGYNLLLAGKWKRDRYYKPTKEEYIRAALYYYDAAPGFEKIMRAEGGNINLKGAFDNFEIPTLIVEGKWDLAWFDPNRVEVLRKNHPHAQIKLFEKSGHTVFADEPDKFFGVLKDFLKKISTMHIAYKPGNRVTWPGPLSEITRKMAITQELPNGEQKDRFSLDLYEQALKENTTDTSIWNYLVNYFIFKKDYEKTLTALQKEETSLKKTNPDMWAQFDFNILAWQGHLLDLLGRRQEALEYYKESLRVIKGRSTSPPRMIINEAWLKDRLKTPFTWDLAP